MSRKDVNKVLSTALDSPELRRAFAQVSQENANRPVRPCRCVVVEIPDLARPEDFASITPGTVTAFVAREGDPLLGKLTETIAADNGPEFNLATDQIQRMATEFSAMVTAASRHAGPRRRNFPSYAEISYADKTLVRHVYLDDALRVQVHAFPYNGGYLDRDAFSMIEYHRADSTTPLTCVLIIRQPKLSEIEREALRLVPSGSSANNVAAAVAEPITPVLLAFFAIAVEAAARWVYNEFVNFIVNFLHGTTAIASLPDAVLEGEAFQNKLRTLPPEVTAVELLRLRTDLLLTRRRRARRRRDS